MQAMGPTGYKRRSPSRQRPPETQEQRDQRFERDQEWIKDELGAPGTAEWAVKNPIDAVARGAQVGYDKMRRGHQIAKQKLVPSFLRNLRRPKGNAAQSTNF